MESVDLIKIYTKGKWLFAIFNSYNKKCYLNSNVRLVCWSKTKKKIVYSMKDQWSTEHKLNII